MLNSKEDEPTEIFTILKSLMSSPKEEEIIKSSSELNEFIQKNKPGLQFLEAEFSSFFATIKNCDIKTLLSSLLKIFKCWFSLNFKVLPYKALCKGLFKIFKIKELEKQNDQKDFIADFVRDTYRFLNVDAFKDFFSEFDDQFIDLSEKIKFVQEKLSEENYSDGTKALKAWNLFPHFDRKSLAQRICEKAQAKKDKGLYELLHNLISSNPKEDLSFLKHLISLLCTNKTVTYSSKIIKKYDLDIADFPDVVERLKKKALRYTLWEKEWFGCEERFCLNDEILGYLVEDLFNDKKYNEAWSIMQRYNLMEKGFVKKVEPIKFFKENTNFQMINNPIYERDSFNPVEENVGKVKQGFFINLRDFGISENNVHYIDSIDDENYNFAVKELESSEIIGIDSEFVMTTTSFEKGGISILQIANDKSAFIFDMRKLSCLPKFSQFFFDLLENQNIAKIGHTISADIKMLKKDQHLALDKSVLRNYVELPHIFKKLKPGDKFTGLAHIAEIILNKAMSKGDQCSNWSKKPLRKSQIHYAALDAVICVILYKKMVELATKANLKLKEFHQDIHLGDNNGGDYNEHNSEEEKNEVEFEEKEKKNNKNSKGKNSKNKNKNKKFEKIKGDKQDEEKNEVSLFD